MESKMLPTASSKKRRANVLSKVKINVWEKENTSFYYEEPNVHHLFSCTKMMEAKNTNPSLSFNMNEWMDETEWPNTSLNSYNVETIQYLYDQKGLSVVTIQVCVTQKIPKAG